MAHKQEYADKHIQTYKSYDSYVKYKEVKKVLVRLKKDIGEINYSRIMDELIRLERIKMYGEICMDSDS